MNKTFITFAAGTQRFKDGGNTLKQQADDTNLFDNLILYDGEYLENDSIFWDKHSTFFKNHKRGYGYWLWKPYIIIKTMEQMKDGDILLYLDSMCVIEQEKKEEIEKLFEIVKTDLIIGSYTCIEKEWNKMDLILELDMLDDKYLNTRQHQATAIMFLVCDKTRELVNKWYEISCNYHLIDYSPSISENLNCFRQHRHDQAIYSLLTKKYNLHSKNTLHSGIWFKSLPNNKYW